MKVAVNLAVSPHLRERYALAWAIPTALIATVVLIYFFVTSLRNFKNYRRYAEPLAKFQSQEARWSESQKRLGNDLNQPQYQKVFRAAKFVNTLIDKKEFSLAELMEKVAGLLPPDVRLETLAFSPVARDSVVRLTVEGKTQKAVETFLSNVEDSPDFKDVTVTTSQGLGGRGATDNQASISLSAVYVGGEN